MSSRDAILHRIRTALAETGSEVELPPTPEVWPRTGADRATLIERFTQELEAVAGEVVRCASMDEAAGKLAEIADEAGWTKIGAIDCPACREAAAALGPDRLVWARQNPAPAEMADLAAGLISADLLLADTGSVMVACGEPEERILCYLPPACVMIGRVGRLVEHMPAAWDEIARRSADKELRGEFVLVTGPSRTADIEKILILGVHGPKRLIVLLVD